MRFTDQWRFDGDWREFLGIEEIQKFDESVAGFVLLFSGKLAQVGFLAAKMGLDQKMCKRADVCRLLAGLLVVDALLS